MVPLKICWRHGRLAQHALRQPSRWQSARYVPVRPLWTSPQVWARRPHRDLDDEDGEVNFFEQDDPSPNAKRRRVNPQPEQDENEELESKLKELEDALGTDTRIPSEISQEEMRQVFSEDERREIAAIADRGLPEDVSAHQISTDRTMPRQSLLHLEQLNQALDEASLNPDTEKARSNVWRWYVRSKPNVPGFLKIIPKAGWELLWATQAGNFPSNSSRATHLKILAEDKSSAGWNLSQIERYALLEGKFLDGDQKRALTEWESQLETDDGSNPEFLEMGLRMYAHSGAPKRAEELLEQCMGMDSSANPRLAIPVLRSYSHLGGADSLLRAWTLYQQMRERLGSQISMADFNVVSLGFLADGHKDFALATFRDMMLCGQPNDEESKSLYNQAMGRISHFMTGGNSEQINHFSLDAVKYLPRRFQNKYFYASWLRKLISEGNVNEAAQVIELMYERGVRPDARHMNGLVNAWFRQGGPHGRQMGEELAWAMIQDRIDFAKRRRLSGSTQAAQSPSVYDNNGDIHIPTFVRRPVTSATVETFGILAQHYLNRGMFGHIRHLRNLLVSAEIQMSAFFMNQLLYAEQRTRGYESVWGRFELMNRVVKPDMQTWACVWGSMKRLVDRSRSQFVEGFPPPREMFRRMMAWTHDLTGKERAIAQDEFDIDTYQDIIRCFCLASDLEGSLIVMHAIKTCFNVYPEETIVKMLLMQVARLSEGKAKAKVRRRRPQSLVVRGREALENETMTQALKVFALVRDGRLKEYEENGHQFEDLEVEQQAEENHRVCLTFLYTIVRRRLGDRFKDNGFINDAMDAMDVERFDIDEVMDLVVS